LVSGALNIKERVKPGSPCFALLRAAMQKVADERRGIIVDEYMDCNGERHECLLAVRTPAFLRAVGVNVDEEGHVLFVYDAQPRAKAKPQAGQLPADPKAAEAICEEITRNYAALAVRRAMHIHGYRTQQRTESGQMIVEGGENCMSWKRAMRVIVDDHGEVHLDLIGFWGKECAVEEDELRETLAALGLKVEVEALHTKRPEEMVAEARALSPSHGDSNGQSKAKRRVR
jgi:hypothetical protein